MSLNNILNTITACECLTTLKSYLTTLETIDKSSLPDDEKKGYRKIKVALGKKIRKLEADGAITPTGFTIGSINPYAIFAIGFFMCYFTLYLSDVFFYVG